MPANVRTYSLKDPTQAEAVKSGQIEVTPEIYVLKHWFPNVKVTGSAKNEDIIHHLKSVPTQGVEPVKTTDIVAIDDRCYFILGGVYTELYAFDQNKVSIDGV